MIKVTKFGGSSVANAEQFRKVKAIIEADESRKFIVTSACGKESQGGEEKESSLQPLSFPVFPTQFGKFEFIRVPRLVDYFSC